MVSSALVRLAAGPLELVLNPALGGSIARFDHVADGRRTAILRGDEGASGDVLAAGCFPLVPFVNRIRGGRFTFRGRTVTLPRNMAGDASPLRRPGLAFTWEVSWPMKRSTAHLRFDHAAGDWPWDYVADQHFELGGGQPRSDAGLHQPLGRSDAMRAWPAPPSSIARRRPASRPSSDVWTIDADVLPVERFPATGKYDLPTAPVCGVGLDHGVGGWGGTASSSDPAWPFTIAMTSPDASFSSFIRPPAAASSSPSQ